MNRGLKEKKKNRAVFILLGALELNSGWLGDAPPTLPPTPIRQISNDSCDSWKIIPLHICQFSKKKTGFSRISPNTHSHDGGHLVSLFHFFPSPPLYFYFGLIPKEGDGSISFSFLFFLSFLSLFFVGLFFVFLFYGFIAGWKIGSSFWLNDFYWSVFPGREERKKEKKNPKKMERK